MPAKYTYSFTRTNDNGTAESWSESQLFGSEAKALAYANFICNADDPDFANVDVFNDYLTEDIEMTGERPDKNTEKFELDNINTTPQLGITCPSILKSGNAFYSH